MTQWVYGSVIAVHFDSSLRSDIFLHFAQFSGSPGPELCFPGSQVAGTPSSITSGMPIKWRRLYDSSTTTAIQLFRTDLLSDVNAAKVKQRK